MRQSLYHVGRGLVRSTPALKMGFLQAPYGNGRCLLCRLPLNLKWWWANMYLIRSIAVDHLTFWLPRRRCDVTVSLCTMFYMLNHMFYMLNHIGYMLLTCQWHAGSLGSRDEAKSEMSSAANSSRRKGLNSSPQGESSTWGHVTRTLGPARVRAVCDNDGVIQGSGNGNQRNMTYYAYMSTNMLQIHAYSGA